jgi:hypothetical protein
MRIAARQIMKIAAVMALTAASASAFAQDDRRSFDDGYAAAQRDHRGPPGWMRVHVEDASYGARGRFCDARRAVHEEIRNNRGAVGVNNNLCGDPAPGAQKRLNVTYRCGDSESVRVVARENETLRLSCRR